MSTLTWWNHYHVPETVEEAVEILARYKGEAKVVGGGTDMLLEIQQGLKPKVEALVDPTRIKGLGTIEEEEGYLVIGCGVTHTQIVNDERVRSTGTCLVESCGVIGGPQVRNVATLAGNIAHALPAGDGTIGLLTLGGDIEVAGPDGIRWMPVEESFFGPGKSTVDSSAMLITRMRFKPTGKNEASAYRRVMRPQGVALPMLSLGSCVHVDGEKVTFARITIGPAGPVPFVAEKASESLVGQEATMDSFKDAAEIALGEATLRTSKHRASKEYRAEMIRIQVPKTLSKAAERAQTGTAEPEGVGL